MTLTPLPIPELTDPGQHFRCEPYAATIRAAVCLERQARHGVHVPLQLQWGRGRGKLKLATGQRVGVRKLDYGRCSGCELGRAVVAVAEGWR